MLYIFTIYFYVWYAGRGVHFNPVVDKGHGTPLLKAMMEDAAIRHQEFMNLVHSRQPINLLGILRCIICILCKHHTYLVYFYFAY